MSLLLLLVQYNLPNLFLVIRPLLLLSSLILYVSIYSPIVFHAMSSVFSFSHILSHIFLYIVLHCFNDTLFLINFQTLVQGHTKIPRGECHRLRNWDMELMRWFMYGC